MTTLAVVLAIVIAGALFFRFAKDMPGNRPKKEKGRLPTPTDLIEMLASSRSDITYKCGHAGPKWFMISAYGEVTKKIEDSDQCHECVMAEMRKLIARCCLCRLPIFPGDGVALYHESNEGLHKDIAVKVGDQLLGCMRWSCCPSGGFFGGRWDGEKFVPAFGGVPAVVEAFRTGKVVIGNI